MQWHFTQFAMYTRFRLIRIWTTGKKALQMKHKMFHIVPSGWLSHLDMGPKPSTKMLSFQLPFIKCWKKRWNLPNRLNKILLLNYDLPRTRQPDTCINFNLQRLRLLFLFYYNGRKAKWTRSKMISLKKEHFFSFEPGNRFNTKWSYRTFV